MPLLDHLHSPHPEATMARRRLRMVGFVAACAIAGMVLWYCLRPAGYTERDFRGIRAGMTEEEVGAVLGGQGRSYSPLELDLTRTWQSREKWGTSTESRTNKLWFRRSGCIWVDFDASGRAVAAEWFELSS